MREPSKQRDMPAGPAPMETPKDKQQPLTPPTETLNPLWRLSPWHNGSTLYDSFELRAVTQQLNKAMQGSSGSSPTFMCHLKLPFYRQRLDRIHKENAKKPRRIMCSQTNHATLDSKASTEGKKAVTRRLVTRLWKKVKQGLLWNKQRNDNQ